MNTLANAWNHPRTSAAGLLIAVVTIAEVLSQNGVSLGKAGSGTIVTLIGALATAVLGLVSRDPAAAANAANPANPSGSSTAKLGAVAMIALLLPLPILGGCSGTTVAQDIVNWTPALQSAVATVDSTVALLAPADAPIFSAATAGFNAASNLLAGQAKAYLANPSAPTLVQLQNQVTAFQQQVNSALLEAAKIVDPASQKHALAAVQGVATIVSTLLALVQSISTKTAVARMASQSTIKLAAVAPYLDQARSAEAIAAHYSEPLWLARHQLQQAERVAMAEGF
jgi:hypothetical protein